jgi:hypothetical protein
MSSFRESRIAFGLILVLGFVSALLNMPGSFATTAFGIIAQNAGNLFCAVLWGT